MTELKLIFRNVQKNLQDYTIYFLTLMLSVSLFYAFNSISSQPALENLGATKELLSNQLGILISALSAVLAVILSFLILYANQFLLKRRKKELGIYTLLGMEKRKIAGIFAGETICIGLLSLVCGLLLGVVLSQGLSLVSLRLFAVDFEEFQILFSFDALKKTVLGFAIIFIIEMVCNIKTISSVKLIELLTAGRKNEGLALKNQALQYLLLVSAVACIGGCAAIIQKHGIIPSRENPYFQVAAILLAVGTALFFYAGSAVLLTLLQKNKNIYLKGLNTFLIRQVGSKIHTNFLSMAVVCGLLTVTICGITVGISTALTMNEASKAALPYDLNVISDVAVSGDTDIAQWLKTKEVDIAQYADANVQLSVYESKLCYKDLFEGQNVKLWKLDEPIPECEVSILTVSDFNKALAMQGKEGVTLSDEEFLLNCNYKGTMPYIRNFLQKQATLQMGGMTLKSAAAEPLQETWMMTSVGNNDRGTLIVPDNAVASLKKNNNVLLVRYRAGANADEILQKMVPIGLEWKTQGYRYTEKNMLNGMFYGVNAILSFVCCYIGLVFLLICAALLSLKQLTETTDNRYRYGLLQKLGADAKMLYSALFWQIAVFFVTPLLVAGVFAAFAVSKANAVFEEFVNMHIATHAGFTVALFLLVYGGYFLATCFSCKNIVAEKH